MRHATSIALSVAVCWVGLTASGIAENTLESAFGAGKSSCYFRAYDQAHLTAHPDQRVQSIFLVETPASDPGWDALLLLGFELLGNPASYRGVAYCRDGGASGECLIEGDGGEFTLSMDGNRLRLTVGDYLILESKQGVSPDLANGGDDRVFLLDEAQPSACD